jgi:hypothetical protein
LEKGEVAVGGFTSRGLGWVALEEDADRRFFKDAQAMLDQLMGAAEGQPVGDEEARGWVKALQGIVKERGTRYA